ncbi:carbamoyltransferase HypF [Corynebacterium sp. 11A]|uniref:carbamoyltransferase HypF n=1 Tax=Corynebacterium sp. 11A TaxID=2080510 RepID=UPI00124C3507|nr:carbamoyltransferase HypF [Corynebacterium sp. 11A]
MVSERRRAEILGVVQGVGFRPHVARCAARFPLTGFCGNSDSAVYIEAQGAPAVLSEFFQAVLDELPPLAQVKRHHITAIPLRPAEHGFRIVASQHSGATPTLLPPDVAVCPECVADMADPHNRRFRYPFTTCTNCGPRLSIIESLPYDRPRTTMREFPMCPRCAAEYGDPLDRRYHAQPISCPDCGPQLWLEREGHRVEGDLTLAAEWLAAGEILAVKGLGGFHLLCDARNSASVARLRRRKHRPHKPFAVMAPLAEVERLAEIDPKLVSQPAQPIVIAPQSADYDLAPEVAPSNADIGIMLPYTPLHTLLVDRPVVATSGNISGEPICFDNDRARDQLAEIADGWVMHDRPIHVPVEDSVDLVHHDCLLPVRRSRGKAPLPLTLSLPSASSSPTVLAVGGELKNTFTLLVGDTAHISAHIGDMGSWATQQAFERAVEQLLSMRRSEPKLVACDLHPNYATTAWAERTGLPVVQVQHHHAHAVSLLAEHQLLGQRAVIATLDGTGYGLDGTIWGGEILSYSPDRGCTRAWHIPRFPLLGGDRAVRHPWRIAAGLTHAYGIDCPPLPAPAAEREIVEAQLRTGYGAVECSSAGRLIDAVSTMLGLCPQQSFEAHAALRLETCARSATERLPSTAGSIPELVQEALDGTAAATAAWRFHHGLAQILATQMRRIAAETGAEIMGISGGCGLNRLMLTHLRRALPELKEHRVVPANDGGLSLGQAVAARLANAGQWVPDQHVHHAGATEAGA